MGPLVQDLDSVLKRTTYLLSLKWVGVNYVPALHVPSYPLDLTPDMGGLLGQCYLAVVTYADLWIILCEQKFIVSLELRLSFGYL